MGDGGDVFDHRHFQAHRLQGADRGLTALAGALDKDLNSLQAMLHSGAGGGLRRGLSVDFLLPRKPRPPEEAQEMALP